eukprot:8692233-Prorocentrum_lima.AAC.1
MAHWFFDLVASTDSGTGATQCKASPGCRAGFFVGGILKVYTTYTLPSAGRWTNGGGDVRWRNIAVLRRGATGK